MSDFLILAKTDSWNNYYIHSKSHDSFFFCSKHVEVSNSNELTLIVIMNRCSGYLSWHFLFFFVTVKQFFFQLIHLQT